MHNNTFPNGHAARIGALFGLDAIALSVIPTFFLGGAKQPNLTASAQPIAAWTERGHDTMMFGAYLDTLGQLFLFVIVVLLCDASTGRGSVRCPAEVRAAG